MLYNKLLEIWVPADWRLMTDEHKALALGAFVVVAILVWNRRLRPDLIELKPNFLKYKMKSILYCKYKSP
jgi:hypothetical protein